MSMTANDFGQAVASTFKVGWMKDGMALMLNIANICRASVDDQNISGTFLCSCNMGAVFEFQSPFLCAYNGI